ncbi:MAG: F0F1 ATP synthase subunit delta [Gammaproteobacteria bacterium]
MSELATLARPYAEAVFKRAKETDSTAKWSDTLAFISAVVSDEIISAAADNPKISKESLLNLMLDICLGQIDKEGENFLKLLVQNNRLKLAKQIATIYEQFKAEDEGYVDVEVSTAFALSKDEEKSLASTLERTLKKKVHLNVKKDRSLIGGVLIRAGDRVIDGSIKGQLQQLAKRL